MNEAPLDVRGTLQTIRRRWRVVLLTVAVAASLAFAYTVAFSGWATAHSLVILPAAGQTTGAGAARDMNTEVRIATSTDVLATAGRAVRPHVSAPALQDRVDVTAPTEDILEIKVRAKAPHDAVVLANAVATSYVDYSTTESSKRVQTLVRALQTQATKLGKQADTLQAQIQTQSAALASLPAGSPAAIAQTDAVTSLQGRYGDTVQQLDAVNRQIGDAELGASLTNEGATVLERATAADETSVITRVRTVGIGAFAGLVIGALLALSLARRDRRLRRRDEIADAVEAPVLASLTAEVVRSPGQLIAVLNRYDPDSADSWSLRQLLQQLGVETDAPSRRVTVLALSGDDEAIMVAPQLVAFSARLGRPAALVIATDDPTASVLRSASDLVAADPGLLRPEILLTTSDPVERGPSEVPDLVVRLLVVGANGPTELPRRTAAHPLVLAVSAGFASTDGLTRIGRAAMSARRPLLGVIVANPDRDDRTTGQLAQMTEISAVEPFVPTPGRVGGTS